MFDVLVDELKREDAARAGDAPDAAAADLGDAPAADDEGSEWP